MRLSYPSWARSDVTQEHPDVRFTILDYLLWRDGKAGDEKIRRSYEFTFRSSVEHYYPQNPKSGPRLPPADANSFGNLCLISHSKNSELSNYSPVAKKQHYEKSSIDSLKQHLMMQQADDWGGGSIGMHYAAMEKVLLDELERAEQY